MHTEYTTPCYHARPRSPKVSLTIWGLSLLFWLVSLLTGAPAKGAEISPPDVYWVVVDRSGSMGPGQGNNDLVGPATEKLNEFIATLDASASLRIVFFSEQAGAVGRWSGLTPATKAAINQWVRTEFQPAGGTRLFDTVGHVLADVLKERQAFGRIGLLVFSDGEDNRSTRFKGWSEIERLSHELVAQQPAAFMRLYSLGKEPRSRPAAPWVVQEAPTAADLRKIVLEPAPEARFKIVPEKAAIGQKVTLVAVSGPGRIDSFLWHLGDGTSSQEPAFEYVYPTNGIFHGSLTVNGPGGTDTKPFSVSVSKPVALTPEFSWSPKAARVGDTLEFLDESSGGPTSWRWFINGLPFGEGRHLSWLASQAGAVAVRLEIVRGGESKACEHSVAILPPKLDASFTVLPGHSVTLGTVSTLKATAGNQGAVHEWYAAGVKVGDNPVLEWTASTAGLMEITHRVVRGVEVAEAIDRVQVALQPPPAEFTVAPGLEVDLGQEVVLTAKTTNSSWRHTFSFSTGETVQGAIATLPTKSVGRIEIIHTVESTSGRSEMRETLLVRDAVTAKFSVKMKGRRAPTPVKFTPHSITGVIARVWAFGDGQTSTEDAPTHTYGATGDYRPILTVRDTAGREHSWQLPEPISIVPPRAWWMPWAITIGVVLALVAGVAAVFWDRQRLLDLDGRLEWQFGGNRGRAELTGRKFDFSSLNIPGWKPVGAYTLVRRKSAGYQLLRDGAVEQAVEEDISLEAEGVRLRLMP